MAHRSPQKDSTQSIWTVEKRFLYFKCERYQWQKTQREHVVFMIVIANCQFDVGNKKNCLILYQSLIFDYTI